MSAQWRLGAAAILLGAASASVVLGRRAMRSTDSPRRLAPLVVRSDLVFAPVVVRAPARPSARGRVTRALDGVPVPVELTSYCLRGTTRRGRWVREGIVAADPRIFPLSRYVELFANDRYLGRFLVDDTGRLIRGPIIDIWKSSCAASRLFGRQAGVAVLVPRRAGP